MDSQTTMIDKTPRLIALQIAILSVAFIAFYHQTFWGLIRFYRTNEDYSYVWLLPVVVGFLIWQRRKMLAQTPIQISWWGGLWFLLFFLVSAYGIVGSSPSAVRPAIPLIMLAIILQSIANTPAVAVGVAFVWLFWTWTGARLLQGLVAGDAGDQQTADLAQSAAWAYALILFLLVAAGIYGIGELA